MSLMTAPVTAPAADREPGGASHVLRPELLHGTGPWTGVALAVLIGVTMYSKADQWQQHWSETTDLLRVAGLILGGPLAVAAGCWQGGRERRRGTEELRATFARSRLRQTLVTAAPAALWPAAGYLVAAAGCLVATWPYTGGGHPFMSLIAADAVAIASLGTLGFIAGRLLPWRLVAPLLAVLSYVVLAVPGYGRSSARWLDPALEYDSSLQAPLWWFGPASALWTGGLAASALLGFAARRRLTALLPVALAAAVAVPIVATGDGLWRDDPAAARPVCDNGVPRICVPAVDRNMLPAMRQALAGLDAKLRGVPGAPERWVHYPVPPRPGDVLLPDRVDDTVRGRLTHPDLFADSAVGALVDGADCASEGADTPLDERASDIGIAVRQWLVPRGNFANSPARGARPHRKRLEAMDAAQGRAYLTRYLAADRCDPAQVPVP